MIKVSVIVPVYNTEKYLKRCLDSLVNQTLKEIEIIVINDCSPGNCKDILREYKEKYNNLKVFHNKINKGIGYNRNFGIKKSTGEYIAFVDSDDYVDVTMYEKLYTKAKKDNLELVICNYHKILEKGNLLEEIPSDFIIECQKNTTLEKTPSLLSKVNLAPWNKLYKKSLLGNDIRFPENLKYEDALFVVKALAKSKKIGFIDEKLNYYLVRSKSETTIVDKRVFDILEITKQMVEELESHSYYEKIKEEVEAWTIRNLFRYTLQQKYQTDNLLKNEFIDEVFDYLNKTFPTWKTNKIWKKRNILKRMIESNKLLTKLYCKF